MKYYKRRFKGIVINFKKVKLFLFIIISLVMSFLVLSSLKMPALSVDFLKYCISSSFCLSDNDNFSSLNINLTEEALIKNALPYIEIKHSDENEPVEVLPKDKEVKSENTQIISTNLSVKNETNYDIDIESLLKDAPIFEQQSNGPLVLIVHTHASESYTSNGEFEVMDTDRTLDTKHNMIKIGEEFVKILSDNGINVIHDKTIHDYPSYTSSYKRALDTIESYLNKYPSIKIVLDIHRDAIIKDDGTKIKLTTNINGILASQVMILCGTDASGLEFNSWRENLKFALYIQKNMENDYPTLARPLVLSENRYNMHKTYGSLLLEIGTNGNTLQEAINGAKLMANSVSKTILELTK